MSIKQFAIGYLSVTIPALLCAGCDEILSDETALDIFTCTVVPYYGGDCTTPEVREKARSVLTDGAVEASIDCLGVAVGPGAVVSIAYQASRLQDGSCLATATVTGPSGATGFAQSQGVELSRRTIAESDRCAVTSWHVPQLRTETWVQSGMVRTHGPFCPQGCTMTVASSCTGSLDKF